MKVSRYPDATSAAEACGRHIMDRLREALERKRRAVLATSGGSSPRPMFELFARTDFPWERVHVFWVDERCVPPNDPASNFGMTRDAWLASSNVPLANIHRIQGELNPQEAAGLYSKEIRDFFGDLGPLGIPHFDVIHRGMGSDGHTASLFPGDPLIDNRSDMVGATLLRKMDQWRVTLLPAVLEAARNTALLVTGRDKAIVMRGALQGAFDPQRIPVQIASRDGFPATWFVDEAAVSMLNPEGLHREE